MIGELGAVRSHANESCTADGLLRYLIGQLRNPVYLRESSRIRRGSMADW
jgi:hypothetical protein